MFTGACPSSARYCCFSGWVGWSWRSCYRPIFRQVLLLFRLGRLELEELLSQRLERARAESSDHAATDPLTALLELRLRNVVAIIHSSEEDSGDKSVLESNSMRRDLDQMQSFTSAPSLWEGTDGRAAMTLLAKYLPNICDVVRSPWTWVMKSQIEGSGAVIFDFELLQTLLQALKNFVAEVLDRMGLATRVVSTKNEKVLLQHENDRPGALVVSETIRKQANNLSEFILMKKIDSPNFAQLLLGPDLEVPVVRKAIGELGIYSCFVAGSSTALRDGKNHHGIVENRSYGRLLRSKGVQTKQGGVFMGHACLDGALLY